MGIYRSGNIFGVRIYNFNNDDSINILFEEKYDEIFNNEKMREIYEFYNKLCNKNEILFGIYTECTSTLDPYNRKNFMNWFPISLNIFLEMFEI